MWDIFLSSLLLSVVLVGIHAYFGREIIRRGIIFADIAVAQFSAVGVALSLLIFHGEGTHILALIFGLFASLLVGLGQKLKEYVEAFVAILYALGFSAIFLLFAHSPHGMEELRRLTASDILFVPLSEVIKTGVFYTFIGLLLYLRRHAKEFLRELSFFLLFSLTLASSVRLVGVLVVFSLLVSPSLVSLLLGRGLLFSWIYGTMVNLFAIVFSFSLDLPTGYTLVFFQSLSGLIVFIIKLLR